MIDRDQRQRIQPDRLPEEIVIEGEQIACSMDAGTLDRLAAAEPRFEMKAVLAGDLAWAGRVPGERQAPTTGAGAAVGALGVDVSAALSVPALNERGVEELSDPLGVIATRIASELDIGHQHASTLIEKLDELASGLHQAQVLLIVRAEPCSVIADVWGFAKPVGLGLDPGELIVSQGLLEPNAQDIDKAINFRAVRGCRP